jgi:hypothetical protein
VLFSLTNPDLHQHIVPVLVTEALRGRGLKRESGVNPELPRSGERERKSSGHWSAVKRVLGSDDE